MRPSTEVPESGEYECYGCGRRVRDPESRICPSCGSDLHNVGRARDL